MIFRFSSGERRVRVGVIILNAAFSACAADLVRAEDSGAVRGGSAVRLGFCGDGECDVAEGERCECFTDCGPPAQTEITDFCNFQLNCCSDGVDGDCDGAIDCADSDCASDPICAVCGNGVCEGGEDVNCGCPEDCGVPTSETIGATCMDGEDNDCDGAADCADSDCFTDVTCPLECGDLICNDIRGEEPCNCPEDCGVTEPIEVAGFSCADGFDNDCDGVADCLDGDCVDDPACVESQVSDFFPHSGTVNIAFDASLGCGVDFETISLTGFGLAEISRPDGPFVKGQLAAIELVAMRLEGETQSCGTIVLRNRGPSSGQIFVLDVFDGMFQLGNATLNVLFEMTLPDSNPDLIAFNTLPVTLSLNGMTDLPPVSGVYDSGILSPTVAMVTTVEDCGNPANNEVVGSDTDVSIPDSADCLFHTDCGDPLLGNRCLSGQCAVVSEIIIADDGSLVADLDVGLLIQHPRRLDLLLDLSHRPSRKSVRLFEPLEQIGGAGNIGNPTNGQTVLLDDDGAVDLDVVQVSNPVGVFRPSGDLAAFVDRRKAGTWRLTVVDRAPGLTGTLLDWSLHFCNGQTATSADVRSLSLSVDECTQACIPGSTFELEDGVINAASCEEFYQGELNGGCDVASGGFEVVDEAACNTGAGAEFCGSIGRRCVENCQPPCETNTECVDAPSDPGGVCTFDVCNAICEHTPARYADFAGGGGACGPDGSVDIFDIFGVLNAFTGVFADGCEFANIDIAGVGGSCGQDGSIDIFDIFAVLNAFTGTDACKCGNPGGSAALGEAVFLADSDWYRIELTQASTVHWTVTSDVSAELEMKILKAGEADECGEATPVATVTGVPCEELSFTGCMVPGTYFLAVTYVDTGEEVACGTYNARVSCGGPCGAACPGDGDCCVADGTPGCEEFSCCSAVCDVESGCCNFAWTQTCADLAADLCSGCAP